MKKLLLTLGVAALTVGAWAVQTLATDIPETFEDVTPTYFKFYEGNTDLSKMIRTDIPSPAQANLKNTNGNFISSNTDTVGSLFSRSKLSEGNLIFGGAYWRTQEELAKGFSLVKLGEEIGEVLVLNGHQSDLVSTLKALGLNENPEVSSMEAAFSGNLQLFWVLDNIQIKNLKYPYLKIKVELNAFNNKQSLEKEALNSITFVTEAGNPFGEEKKVCFNEFLKDNSNEEWDPYKWMVYEFYIDKKDIGSYLRMFINDSLSDLNNGALLIRSIEVYGVSEIASDITKDSVNKTWNDYTPETVKNGNYKITQEKNVITFTFDKEFKKVGEDSEITVSNAPSGLTPSINVDEANKTITVTLTDFPAKEYKINIPEGFVKFGPFEINEAISETITIGKEYETGTVAPLQGDQIGFTVTYSKDITNLQPTGQITLTPKTPVTTQPSLKKTQNGNVLTVTLDGGEAAVYTVTIPKDYFTLDVNLFSDKVSQELTVEKKYETGTVALLEGDKIGFTVTYPMDIIELLTGEIKVEPIKSATNLPAAKPTKEGKVLTVVLEGGDPGDYTVTVPKEYVKLGVNLFNNAATKTLNVPETGSNPSVPTEPETPEDVVGTNITPKSYHFGTTTNLPLHPEYINVQNIVKETNDVYSDANLASSYEDGLIVVSTGGGQSAVEQSDFRNSLQLINLGGEVGNVLFYGTKGSGIVNVLKNKASDFTTEWDKISVNPSTNRNWQLNFFMPPTYTQTNGNYVHCRVIYNVFSANSDLTKAPFNNMGMIKNNNAADASFTNSGKDKGIITFADNDCYTDGEWDPTKWQVVEFDFTNDGNVPYRFRIDVPGPTYWDNLALFIKDIKFTEVKGDYTGSNIKKYSVTYKDPFTYTLGDQIITRTKRIPVVNELGEQSEEKGFTLSFDGDLYQGTGEITITTTENVTTKPQVKSIIKGKTLTVTLEGGDAAEYTVTVPEGFVNISNHSFNAPVKQIITINNNSEDQDDPNYPKVNPGTDITPANYNFNDPKAILPIHPTGKVDNVNLGASAWKALNCSDYWDNGLMVVSSGGGLTQVQHDAFKNAWNYVDFGGKVGRVACYINRGSTAIEDLKKLNSIEAWDDLNKNTQVFSGGALNFYLDPDPKNTPKTGYIHAKIVFNVDDLNESVANGVILQNINVRDDLNNNECSGFVLDPITGEKVNVLKNEFTTNGKWDPTKWMTYEFDFKVDGTDKSADLSQLPVRIKMFFQGSQANNTSAIFFKEISFTHVDDADPTMLGKVYQKMETLEIGTPKISFIPAEKMAASSVNVNENVLTATFDQNITLDETKSVTISPSSTTGKLDVKVNDKSIVVTLTDYPYYTYTVTIPEGFVKVGDKGINEEIVQEIEISAPKVKDKEYYFPSALDIPAGYIDMTPSYYKFYNGKTDLDKMLRNDINSPTATNLGGDYFITNNMGDGKYFNNDNLSKGNLIYKAGMYQNDKDNDRLRSAFSLFDFGGNVGEVLVLNGKNSKLNEAIAENFNLQTSYNISKPAGDFMNMQLMWLLDNPKMNSNLINGNYTVHVRMELNMYNNNMATEYPLMSNMYLQRQTGTTAAEFDLNDKFIDEFTYRVNEESYKEGEFNVNKTDKWNPYRWMVLDFETDYNRVVSYLRTFLQSNQMKDHSNGAWLIRSIEIYGIPSNVTSTYEKNKLYTSWNEYKASDFIVKEPTPEQAKEDPSEKSIVENTIPGDKVENEASFNGFQDDKDHENSWTIEDAKVAKYYYYNVSTGKNVTLADEATKDVVKVDANTITISAPADMGTEYHHGIVRINTGIEIQEGATYNFSAQATKVASTRAAANVPDILVKLTAESSNATSGLANKTENGVHYLSNAELTAGNLVLEIHFGGAENAGNDITLSNITLAQLTEGSSGGNNSGGNPGVGDEGGFIPGDYSGEPTVNRAMQFTQSGTVTCGAIPELNNLSSYSIQFWMKPQEWEEGATLLRRGDNFSVELGENHNIVFKNSDNEVIAKGLLANEWNQVTLMVNKGQATVLVNSVNGGSGTLGTLEETKRPFIMGGGYVGLLDEVRLWNDALSNNDLMTRFDYFTNNTLNKWNPMWNNLVAYYKMDQEAAPQVIEYKVLENRKADGTNNHGVISEVGVQRVLANNEKMPYLINAAYTENERFYDRLIPQDAYLLSNEIIVLGADCQASDGSVKTRLGNNHASIYGGVSYASIGGRTGVASFDGKSGSYIQAPAGIVHSYTADGNSYNSDYKTYSFLFRIYIDTWQPGACIFSNENSAKTAGFAVLLGDSPKTLTIRANGKTNTTKVMDKFNLGGWNHIAIVPNASSRSAATKYDLYVGATKCDFDASASAIEDIALANVVSNPAKIGEGFKGYLDEMYFSNQSLGLGMIQAYANRVIVPTVEQGRNVAEMNASGFLYNFDNPRNLGYSSFSQDYIADYIRSLYSGYSPAKVVLSVRGHNESGKSDNFSEIWGNDTKVRKFAQDLINAASNYDGVEFDLEWCQNATQWSNLSKLSDAVEALLPAGKTFRISVHAAYYDFPKAKINHNNITGFTVQQYGPNATFYPYSTFTKTLKDMESYGYPKDKVMPSFSTTMQGGGDIRGGAFANYKLNDNDVDTYNGMSFMGPMQIFKRARYARENNYQGIFYWAMGNDYWLGDKNMGSGGVANYQGMPEFNGAKYCSYGLNANVDRVVLSAKISHPDTEYAEGEEVVIPDLDDEFGDNVGDNPGDDDNNGDTSNVNSLDSVEYVDVYTIGGVLIKKNAVKSELNNQLEKGIYIIDGKQTLVR
ncbi:MAG: hypothetical protein J1F67_02930 [Muribaculaceae bacterium]|nr:hypothetical protein [Muribaculaceae bacterium]